MTDSQAVKQPADPTWAATLAALCHFCRAYYHALHTWGLIGLLLMLAHWTVYAAFGANRAKQIGIDRMLLDAAGVGSFLVFSFFIALALWSIHAIRHWRVLRTQAHRITRWVGETTTAAAALFSGIAVVAICPAVAQHDHTARLLLFYTAILLVMLFVMNWILALARSFSRDQQGRAMGLVVLIGLAVECGVWIALHLYA